MKSNCEELCPLCNVEIAVTKHHVVPKSKGGKDTVKICRPCHNQIHLLFTNKEIKNEFNTLEKLKSNEHFSKFLKWRLKHPSITPKTKQSNQRKKFLKYS